MDWLKREMNLTPPQNASTAGSAPFGLSWFHFLVMVALMGFAAVMVGMYYRKMRRAADLVQALTGTAAPAPTPAPTTRPAKPARLIN